jgi:hypothetical protein
MKLKSLTNKKAILGLNTVKAFIIVLLSLAIIGIVTLVILSAIQNSSIAAPGSAAYNGTSVIIQNVSTGMLSFFSNASTYFALLGVVVIILIISLVVVVVNRFGGEAQPGSM